MLVLTVGFMVACSGKDKPAAAPDTRAGHVLPDRKPDATYEVRGEIATLPTIGDKRTELRVRHEAIDDFKNRDGEMVGMNAMTMDFPPAKGVDLSNLKKGDKVKLKFSVWWGNSPAWLVVKIEKLSSETELTFGKANPPGAK